MWVQFQIFLPNDKIKDLHNTCIVVTIKTTHFKVFLLTTKYIFHQFTFISHIINWNQMYKLIKKFWQNTTDSWEFLRFIHQKNKIYPAHSNPLSDLKKCGFYVIGKTNLKKKNKKYYTLFQKYIKTLSRDTE